MELTQGKITPTFLTITRHALAMAVAALANPLIYFDSNPFEAWAITLVGAIAVASVLFGVLSVIQPHRARQAFPMTLIKSAWLILALMVFSKWQDYRVLQSYRDIPIAPISVLKAAPAFSEIEEAMKNAPEKR